MTITILFVILLYTILSLEQSLILIYLHGAPASGKLTIANSILSKVPGRLFDNHAAIDLARTMFEFGSEGFWSLVTQLRLETIQKALDYNIELVVMTSCYSHPENYEAFEEIELIVKKADGKVLPVYLDCSLDELETRVTNQSRVNKRKIRTIEALRKFLDSWNITPIPRENCFQIESHELKPIHAAEKIIKHFNLLS